MGIIMLVQLWWYARQRRVDMDILWPMCLKGANDLEHAKAAFTKHALQDPAWLSLGEDQVIKFIDKLEAYD
jgi:hypothetical protein